MLNSAIIQGRICANPELRHTPNDIAVTTFTVATDKGSGDKKQTSFIDCVAWRGTAELVCKWFQKGSAIIVQGSIQTRSYQDKDGNKRKAFEIVADNVHFAEPKRDGDSHGGNRAAAASQRPDVGADDFDEIPASDDLPF
nr:MAG TPA: Single strand binding protein [Caudoviricetes sp.]